MSIKTISEIETSLQKLSDFSIINEIADNYILDFSKYRTLFYQENGFVTSDLEYEISFNSYTKSFEKVEGTQLPLLNDNIISTDIFNRKYFVSPNSVSFNGSKFDGIVLDAYDDIDNMTILLFLFSQKNIKTINNTKRQKSKREEIFKYISKKISFLDYFLNFYSYDEDVYNKFIQLFIPKNISVTFFKNVKSGKILEVVKNIDAVALFKINYPLTVVDKNKFLNDSKKDIYLKDFFDFLPLYALNDNVDTDFIKKTLYSEQNSFFGKPVGFYDCSYRDKLVNPNIFRNGVLFMFISFFITHNISAIENLLKDDFDDFSSNHYLLCAFSESVILFRKYLSSLIDDDLEILFNRNFVNENKIFRINKYLNSFDKKYLTQDDMDFIKKSVSTSL